MKIVIYKQILILFWFFAQEGAFAGPSISDCSSDAQNGEAKITVLGNSVNRLCRKASFENLNPVSKRQNCIKNKDISSDCIVEWTRKLGIFCPNCTIKKVESPGGTTVKNLYLITDKKSKAVLYVIKNVADSDTCGGEVLGLENVRNGIFSKQVPEGPDLPKITQFVDARKFESADGAECLIALEAAQGKSLEALSMQYEGNPKLQELVASQVGKTLGVWHAQSLVKDKKSGHLEGIKTFVHGDANHGNIFMKPEMTQGGEIKKFVVSFIDNASMSYGDPLGDVYSVLGPWKSRMQSEQHEIERIKDLLMDEEVPDSHKETEKKKISKHEVQVKRNTQMIERFIDSYLTEYTKNGQISEITQLRKKIESWLRTSY